MIISRATQLSLLLAFIILLNITSSDSQNAQSSQRRIQNQRQGIQRMKWKQRGSTSTTPATTTAMRGDQQPMVDDNDYHVESLSYNQFSWNKSPSTQIPFHYVHIHHHRARPPTRGTQQRVHPCEQSSCYPATGNLLIGRENRLQASSTCGLGDPERFCIVSHLETEKKCFLCDTRAETENDPLMNHRVGQIIYKNRPGTLENSWWQSENGKENVSIQLDLEAEFHFTHLIIVFATFRPAAMLIERSYDFGKSWHVYKYFASNCAESFPDAPTDSRNITDVVCDHRYSSVEPSKNGEVIFRVLPPHMKIENPYADHVQNMLKMTNLRINFTKLHSLGDTLLDDRSEIQEKYYYGISNMVVRGSCSCYGHASRCLPLEGFDTQYDMVHGRCECTHNTKGLNCEHCEDFYNDLPWKPALGKLTNACKKCNCNNHANSCHFDQAVYEHSGRISGGFCDNCEHNTQGQHCEQCLPFFYRDPNEDILSPYVCKPCDCDPTGSLDDGICDSIAEPESETEAGSCHCKKHVKGRRCDICKDGYWNLTSSIDGCVECTCNTMGTVNNSGCNFNTGECTCKRLVTGRDCNQCMPETYGLSESKDGCSLCNCDAGGSLDNNCDVLTGQCMCRPYMQGRDCSEPKQNHFIPDLHIITEAESTFTVCEGGSSFGNCTIVVKEQYPDRPSSWTGTGYIRVNEGADVSFTIDGVPRTMNYDVQVRYAPQIKGNWEDVRISLIRPDSPNSGSECYNINPLEEQDRNVNLIDYGTSTIALEDLCLEQGKVYKFVVSFHRHSAYESNPSAQILIDSLTLIPRIEVTSIFSGSSPADYRKSDFDHHRCNESYYDSYQRSDYDDKCKELLKAAGILIFNGASPCDCNPTGSLSKKCDEQGGYCKCKTNVVGRQCERCAPGTFGFGPNGCQACDCDSIGAEDNECNLITGQCRCLPNTYGRGCNQCQIGYWNFPDCQACNCNGHAQTCDSKTGECLSCQDSTHGYNCDRCIEGYYGDPLLGSEIGCRPCRCPDTIASGHSYAEQCALISSSNDVICYCQQGYAGARCDVCDNNYFGNPDKPGGSCQECNCNNNADLSRTGNCDARTGKCQKCLYDTEGDHCEYCRDGYYGDASRQDCRRCECDVLGTNGTVQFCDRYTGQCPCLKNVIGTRCDECIENHWKIASGQGCEACDCDRVGSNSEQCNPYDGQCDCTQGFGGRACDQCETNFWGDPNVECKDCNCNSYGSATHQCDRETGQCVCIQGMGGYKCDQCARGYLGEAPYCSPCGECFDNWDDILNSLSNQTNDIIERAKQIKTQGATGAYTKEFVDVEKKIDIIKMILQNTTVSAQDISEIDNIIDNLRKQLTESEVSLKSTDSSLDKLNEEMTLAAVEIENLKVKSEKVKEMASQLKENATTLQEENVEGALNLTRDTWNRVQLLSEVYAETQELNAEADRQCKRIENQISRQLENEQTLEANDNQIKELQEKLNEMSSQIPQLNEQVCDKAGDPCDSLCGGAGCGKHCGGISCEKGALTRAETALNYAKDTEKIIMEKEEQSENLIRTISYSKTEATDAFKKSKETFDKVQHHYNATDSSIKIGRDLITNLTNIISNNTASPNEIKTIAENTLKLDLHLDPEGIKYLANRIDQTVSELENVEYIIENTRNDLEYVEGLKENSTVAKNRADAVLERAQDVVKALDEAEQAQVAAREAIKKANEDIEMARSDLEHIDTETTLAKKRANETAVAVEQLQQKLNKLQKKFLKNDFDAKEIKSQADGVKDGAEKTHNEATKLRTQYKDANVNLNNKASSSESARERAQKLLQLASKITVDTSSKLKELKDMVKIASINDQQLGSMDDKVNKLNGEIDAYIRQIQEKSDHYRQCTS